jgi:hypothetical protein
MNRDSQIDVAAIQAVCGKKGGRYVESSIGRSSERAVAAQCVLAQPSTRQLNVLVLRGQRQPLAEGGAPAE